MKTCKYVRGRKWSFCRKIKNKRRNTFSKVSKKSRKSSRKPSRKSSRKHRTLKGGKNVSLHPMSLEGMEDNKKLLDAVA